MQPQEPSAPGNPAYDMPRPPRQRGSAAELMQGGRELVLVHEGQEYILRITKTGKLILTKEIGTDLGWPPIPAVSTV